MSNVTRLKMMWDYYAFPLWNVASNDPPVVVDELPLSARLRRDLQRWSDEVTDVAVSSSVSGHGQTVQDWDRRGLQLLRRVREELGPDYEVGYFKDGEVDWGAR